ncbi:hypothetical protein EV182_003816, partial [Spiromyces aspiralis]
LTNHSPSDGDKAKNGAIAVSDGPVSETLSPMANGSHTTEKSVLRRYACPYSGCCKNFKRHEHLKRHIRTHTGEKPFKCHIEGCGKGFARMDNLHQHIRTHINRKTNAPVEGPRSKGCAARRRNGQALAEPPAGREPNMAAAATALGDDSAPTPSILIPQTASRSTTPFEHAANEDNIVSQTQPKPASKITAIRKASKEARLRSSSNSGANQSLLDYQEILTGRENVFSIGTAAARADKSPLQYISGVSQSRGDNGIMVIPTTGDPSSAGLQHHQYQQQQGPPLLDFSMIMQGDGGFAGITSSSSSAHLLSMLANNRSLEPFGQMVPNVSIGGLTPNAASHALELQQSFSSPMALASSSIPSGNNNGNSSCIPHSGAAPTVGLSGTSTSTPTIV